MHVIRLHKQAANPASAYAPPPSSSMPPLCPPAVAAAAVATCTSRGGATSSSAVPAGCANQASQQTSRGTGSASQPAPEEGGSQLDGQPSPLGPVRVYICRRRVIKLRRLQVDVLAGGLGAERRARRAAERQIRARVARMHIVRQRNLRVCAHSERGGVAGASPRPLLCRETAARLLRKSRHAPPLQNGGAIEALANSSLRS
jgi:hypothetical protein